MRNKKAFFIQITKKVDQSRNFCHERDISYNREWSRWSLLEVTSSHTTPPRLRPLSGLMGSIAVTSNWLIICNDNGNLLIYFLPSWINDWRFLTVYHSFEQCFYIGCNLVIRYTSNGEEWARTNKWNVFFVWLIWTFLFDTTILLHFLIIILRGYRVNLFAKQFYYSPCAFIFITLTVDVQECSFTGFPTIYWLVPTIYWCVPTIFWSFPIIFW